MANKPQNDSRTTSDPELGSDSTLPFQPSSDCSSTPSDQPSHHPSSSSSVPTQDHAHPHPHPIPLSPHLHPPSHSPSPPSADLDDYHDSPRSILSWNDLNDILSISDSSTRGDSTPAHSLLSEDHHPDLDPAPMSSFHDPISNPPDHPSHHPLPFLHHLTLPSHLRPDHPHLQRPPSPELLAAITRHLVMPRLPMIPSPSTHSSRPSSLYRRSSTTDSSSPSHPPQLNHLFDPSPLRPSLPPPRSSGQKPRVLVLGDAPAAHGLGSFDIPSSSSQPQLDRIHDCLPHFRFSDPSTYPGLIEFIEGPFNRLKDILNPSLWNADDQSSCPPNIWNDLMGLLDCWIEREAYLLLLVEIESFPLPPDKLEFVLCLSRLLPIIPYIPRHVPLPRAIDGHAILTRQFNAKRIQHFPIPHPRSTPQPLMTSLPGRDECLFRSSRCAFDWLTVEYASRTDHGLNTCHQEPLTQVAQHSSHAYDLARRLQDIEPDRWSEKVSQRITRRSKGLGLNLSSVEDPSSFQLGAHFPAIKPTIDPRHPSCLPIDSLGLPSLGVLIRLGIQELKRRLMEVVSVSLSSRSVASGRPSPPNHPLETRNRRPLGSHRALGSELRPGSSSPDRFDPSIHPLPVIFPPHSDPRPSTAAWFMIGFVTATTAAAAAAFTVWWRSGLML